MVAALIKVAAHPVPVSKAAVPLVERFQQRLAQQAGYPPPVRLFQFEASVTKGMWYARSDEFLQQSFLETLRWIRTFGDVVFIAGAVAVAWQVVILGLWRKGARG